MFKGLPRKSSIGLTCPDRSVPDCGMRLGVRRITFGRITSSCGSCSTGRGRNVRRVRERCGDLDRGIFRTSRRGFAGPALLGLRSNNCTSGSKERAVLGVSAGARTHNRGTTVLACSNGACYSGLGVNNALVVRSGCVAGNVAGRGDPMSRSRVLVADVSRCFSGSGVCDGRFAKVPTTYSCPPCTSDSIFPVTASYQTGIVSGRSPGGLKHVQMRFS